MSCNTYWNIHKIRMYRFDIRDYAQIYTPPQYAYQSKVTIGLSSKVTYKYIGIKFIVGFSDCILLYMRVFYLFLILLETLSTLALSKFVEDLVFGDYGAMVSYVNKGDVKY